MKTMFVPSNSVYVDSTPKPFPRPQHNHRRTAVVISGSLRSGNITFLSGNIYEQRHASYFGSDDPPTPIRTQLEHLISPIAKYGGVDLFIYIPADSIIDINPNWDGNPITYIPFQGDTRGCGLYKHSPIFASHTGNKVFCMTEVQTQLSNQIINAFSYWRKYYFQNPGAKESFLQQEYGKWRANLGVKEYSMKSGVSYKYKIRLRPDVAVVNRIPDIESLIFRNTTNDCKRTVYFPSAWIFGVSGEDSFNIGLAKDMDFVLDRYIDLLTKPYMPGKIPSIPKNTWNSEGHLLGTLQHYYEICLITHKDIWMAKMRVKGYQRSFNSTFERRQQWILINPDENDSLWYTNATLH